MPRDGEWLASELRHKGIRDRRVLAAIASVPRERFVPGRLRELAYDDDALPIGAGQTISQPYVVARMTEVLELRGHERVLEIGTGSGYQAAVPARLCRAVFSIEVLPALAGGASAVLRELGIDNVEVRTGDGSAGWPEAAPFDAVLSAAVSRGIPPAWREQLVPGGRMVLPVGDPEGEQNLILVVKGSDGVDEVRALLPVRFVPLVDPGGQPL